ncbi:FAD-binding oxidoreductase [Effusibacillus pohliae]|uniref:FAD-binding oxidoreductase n=1 Tax=Effusibacillus pohliae TaxID=232270 RepID=UPI00036E1574|nr:FAD-binding oxidoreductase [Effusibacillus pohliae]
MQKAAVDGWKIRSDLLELVGSASVSECSGVLKRKLGISAADLLLVEPDSEEQVAAVLAYANRRRLAVVPIGNGQQLHIGSVPYAVDLLLSSRRLNGFVEHSVGDLTVTVKAGTPFQELQEYLKQHGQFVPVTPPTLARSTIGGLVATAAIGPERVLYGSWRDHVIGLRLVYPNGQVIRTGGKVVKNVAGYDMNKLFVGSHGTLAFIAEVTLKLRPYPKHRELVLAVSEGPAQLIELAAQVLASECIPSALELIRAKDSGSRENGTGSYRLAIGCDEVESAARYQDNRIRQMAADIGGIQLTTLVNEDVETFWSVYRDAWQQTTADSLLIRAACPLPQMETVLRRFETESATRHVKIEYAASLGTGTLRIRLQADDGGTLVDTAASLRELAEATGGYAVIEHAEPELKRKLDVWGTIRGGLSLMKGIKQTIDPAGILSPGRFVGGI